MAPRLRIDPKSAVPIWAQIEEAMRRLVASGALPSGAAAPSVRELAHELLVNPATVSKAYQRLIDAGLLVVRRGEGTFVAPQPRDFASSERKRALAEAADRYARTARELGIDPAEALQAVREHLEDKKR